MWPLPYEGEVHGEDADRRARAQGQVERHAGTRAARRVDHRDGSEPARRGYRSRQGHGGRGYGGAYAREERPARMVWRQARRPRERSARPRSVRLGRRGGGSPLILYLDTSALVKLYVREAGTEKTRAQLDTASMVATSRVAYPEARAALARRQREAGITRAALARAVVALDRDLGRFVVVELSAKVAKRAGDLAERRALRGFDAIHLASALEVEELTGAAASFCCFDDRLREAASAERLPI